MAYGRRKTNFDPAHYCARCGRKCYMSELEWQRGKLLCTGNSGGPSCYDVLLVGDREAEINLVLGDGKEELSPDPKLREPDVTTMNDDIFL
jgi:hypothetical protein